MPITNCHVHLFTHKHTPARYLPLGLRWLRLPLRSEAIRRTLLATIERFDQGRRSRLARLARIVHISHGGSQERVFQTLRSFYPEGTRFVVLPMDMEHMGAGPVEESIEKQHEDLATIAAVHPEVIPFFAADPRRDGLLDDAKRWIEGRGFRGIKLYPNVGYHPADPRLEPLYAYAAEHGIPVLSHCSPPAHVQFRGEPTEAMRRDPETGERLDLDRFELLEYFADPDRYAPILKRHQRLRLCLAHWGGGGEWERFLEDQWGVEETRKSWLAKIRELIRSGEYPGLYTDVSYTVFANDEYVYLLKVLLSDPLVRERVLFGSDFYVVENAELEERRRSVRIRAVLGEGLFEQIASTNPRAFLG